MKKLIERIKAKFSRKPLLVIPDVSGMLLNEEIQNECWFQIVNTVEDMSSEQTWDEVIKMLKLNYMVVPRNYR